MCPNRVALLICLGLPKAIWNRVQRADGANEKWRTLDSRLLHSQRL
jgi:hypothetical protein